VAIPAHGSTLDVSGLASGMYWLAALTTDGEVSGRLFVE
jgi:hypothetical protein